MHRNLSVMFGALVLVLAIGDLAFAAGTAPAAIGMGLSVLGIGIGLGLIGYGALSGIARQPEQAGTIQTAMLIVGGLVEGAGILSLILCLVTIFLDK
jgi:F-type H+-transporting ATPase subunit c